MTDSERPCPVQMPKLLRAESRVETCASCGMWIERYPAFMGENDGYWECDRCDNTSYKIRAGRPYGPRSARWEWVSSKFEELWLYITPWDRDTVTTEPPMNSLDWEAVERWWNSQNIYNVYIGVMEVREDES